MNLSAKTLWAKSAELVSLEFKVYPLFNCALYPRYTIGLHAWFLQQIQAIDAELSAYMHDGGSEKPFTISGLSGQFASHSQSLQLQTDNTYRWRINGLCKPVTQGIAAWLKDLPDEIDLKDAPLAIDSVQLVQPATTYAKLLTAAAADTGSVSFSFVSPTSFRRKGHHLPLPLPTNVFHSYLRRWNHFARKKIDQVAFLDWVDQHVIVHRHNIESIKVVAGKQGSVTGFMGAVTYQLDRQASEASDEQADFQKLFYALARYSSFCGTGHKTTFGLGETQLGWQESAAVPAVPTGQQLLAERIEELTALFLSTKKRQGGKRAQDAAQKWATILARREQGDGLDAIAHDMD
ncbi:MAG: CRISPR-associated endoribonuclease Cas6 [Cyanobacteria bacterium J06631_9]